MVFLENSVEYSHEEVKAAFHLNIPNQRLISV
jgi:hypothetical protein